MSFKIYLLGQFSLQANNLPLELPSRSAQSLLAYLVLHAGVSHRRETLANLLWPETSETNARGYLRQALWRIRKSLGSGSLAWQDYLQINDISVTFNSLSDYWLDADLIVQPTGSQTVEEMIEILNLFQGELLPGFYNEWIVLERDRFSAAFHQKINLLLECLVDNKQWDEVLKWGEQWILLGYSAEPAYRALMLAHAGLGDQSMVLATYKRCAEAMDRELGLIPSPETQQLFEQILDGERSTVSSIPFSPVPTTELPSFLDDEADEVEKYLFVARESELIQLERFLNQAESGQGRVVFITGEAGTGKTALIQEFTKRAQNSHNDLIVASGNCNEHSGIGDPYLPFREILELLTGDVESRWAAGALTSEHARLLWKTLPLSAQALLDVGPDLVETFVAGNALITRAAASTPIRTEWLDGLNELVKHKTTGTVDLNPNQHNLFDQYTRVLQELSRQVLLVLVIDDLQWADLGSISLLFHIGRQIMGCNILIVGVFRPEEIALERDGNRHPLMSVLNEFKREYGEITVNLDQTQGADFIEALIDHEPNLLGLSFRKMLYEQTHGHPLFTIELLRGLQESGGLIQDQHGNWIEGSELDWETMPGRVEAVIAERIGRLSIPMQAALRVASLEGEVFTAEVVAQIQGIDAREMLEYLSTELERKHRLVKAHSIQRMNGQLLSSYRFQHHLFQKYLYGSLDEVERVHLHEQVGTVLEGLYSDQEKKIAIAPQLARHFHEARIADKEIDYLRLAGERAVQMSAYQEAITHLTKGLELLMTQPDTQARAQRELTLQLGLGKAWVGPEGYGTEVKLAYTRSRELCEKIGDNHQLCHVLGELSVLHYVQAKYFEARELGEEALSLAQQLKDPILVAVGHWYLGFIWFSLGEYKTAQAHLKHVISFYNAGQHHRSFVVLRGSDAGISALSYDALCLWCLGYPDQAYQNSQEAIAIARELNHPFTLVDALSYAGCLLHSMRHDTYNLRDYAQQMKKIAFEKGFAGWTESAVCFQGEVIARLGQFQEGIAQIREGIEGHKSSPIRCPLIGALHSLAEVLLVAGLSEEGLSTIGEAINLMETTGERLWEADLYRVRAELLLLQNDDFGAEESLQKAIQVARQQEAKSWELRATSVLARLWFMHGKKEEAHQILSEIYSWFTEGFDSPDLKDARKQLEELS
jgi:DNA-binding SARP family transcriptional activator/predicted ATPase